MVNFTKKKKVHAKYKEKIFMIVHKPFMLFSLYPKIFIHLI